MQATIYHNPKCGTSRNTLAMLKQAGITPTVIEYLQNMPDRATLTQLIKASGLTARQFMRAKEARFKELGLQGDNWSDEELIGFMLENPILMNRPVVVTDLGTRQCRPSEVLLEILPEGAIASFTKEDGEQVTGR
ncbi:arsenate reductase (glutaredoxin) [Polycladidibacter hongkongensis]|uniref:arsenate reductase (glutaredoxin) n=1 Tax=Polycladidibacter hongkongensis TaxID=1647556 RepID=UPI00082ADE8F|nr:arsenate reductase (glutaredoxin) [Pseudovibrio hongkongensis]